MKRMEIRCCCTPSKLLGTVPVPDHSGSLISLPLMGRADAGRPPARIEFEVATWARDVFDRDLGGYVRVPETALKHEGVTIETLRRIPGFIESTP